MIYEASSDTSFIVNVNKIVNKAQGALRLEYLVNICIPGWCTVYASRSLRVPAPRLRVQDEHGVPEVAEEGSHWREGNIGFIGSHCTVGTGLTVQYICIYMYHNVCTGGWGPRVTIPVHMYR